MKTKLVSMNNSDEYTKDIQQAAKLIAHGDVVAFPTETVYGLGGNGWSEEAVSKIYKAKGRPSDNPLILHVCDMDMVEEIVSWIPDTCKKAMEAFWPGPLTVILPKSNKVPECVTGGLDSVAIRMPKHPVALDLIKTAGVPIAAPSANLSGRPSPTKASHVMEDLEGRISMILDGGVVKVGVESTIVDFTREEPIILRPGYITKEDLEEMLHREVKLNVVHTGQDSDVPKAPGMKYKHYAPKAQMTLVLGTDLDKVIEEIQKMIEKEQSQGKKVGVLATEESKLRYQADEVVCVGVRKAMDTVVAGLYDALREFDHRKVDVIFSEGFLDEPLEEAVMNRLVKAAGNQIIRI